MAKNSIKGKYVFATPTGMKLVDKESGLVVKHVGSLAEVKEHKAMGKGAGDNIFNTKELSAEEKAAAAKKAEAESSINTEERIFISKKEFNKLKKEEKQNYEQVSGKGYTLIENGAK